MNFCFKDVTGKNVVCALPAFRPIWFLQQIGEMFSTPMSGMETKIYTGDWDVSPHNHCILGLQ